MTDPSIVMRGIPPMREPLPSNVGDPNVGEFSDAVALKKFGDVPENLNDLQSRPYSRHCTVMGMIEIGS